MSQPHWTATKLIDLYKEYHQPRVRNVAPSIPKTHGKMYKQSPKSNLRFEAWLRVVTEPRYPEFEKILKSDYACPEFEAILAVSLALMPFVPQPMADEAQNAMRGALIPVSAAAIYADVHIATIHRWIERGLEHQKKGAYYWVVVRDLERFYNMKRRHKVAKHKKNVCNPNELQVESSEVAIVGGVLVGASSNAA